MEISRVKQILLLNYAFVILR